MDFEVGNGELTPTLAGREVMSDETKDNEFELLAPDPNEKIFDIGKTKGISENPDIVRHRLRTAKERLFQEYYGTGRDLFMTLHSHLYLKWGYQSFAEFVDTEVGLSLSYAMNYIRVFNKFNNDLAMTPEQLEGIGVTKALALTANVVNRGNASEWIEKAKNKTTKELQEEIKLSRPPKHRAIARNSPEAELSLAKAQMDESILVDDTDDVPIMKTFYLYPKQLEFIESVLTEMPARTKSNKPGNNLTLLVLEHQAQRAEVGGKTEERPQTILDGFAATFGGVVRWCKTKEQAKAMIDFINNNPDIFKEG